MWKHQKPAGTGKDGCKIIAVGDVTMVCPSLFTVNDSDFWVELSYMSRSAQGFFPLGSLSLALSLLP